MPITRRAAGLAAVTVAVVLLAGCSGSSGSSDSSGSPSSSAPRSSATATGPALAASANTYVSVGDSYAAGYQPSGPGDGEGATTRNGFAYQAVTAAKAKGYDLDLVNFGCSGATTASALRDAGCRAKNLGPGATAYTTPQVTAAAAYLRAHRGKVALVSISLGGNDITKCKEAADVQSCVTTALKVVTGNLATIVRTLRSAAGPATRIVGLTYPDIFLGEALSKDPKRQQLANLSALAFRQLINPELKSTYVKGGATFADVTAATGAYTDSFATTTLAPYGKIPVAVAKICTLTYYCQYQDIHPRTNGYKIIADLVVKALPAR